jgi:hypothetical protein
MSLYAPEDERRIRSQTLVREWTRSGLLDPSQGAALDAELRVGVRRTNGFLRAGLALFTVLIVAASVMLILELFDLSRPISIAITAAVSAVVCLGLSQYLVVRLRLYRFGVEEALAVAAVVLMGISAAFLVNRREAVGHTDVPLVAFLLVGAVGGFVIHWRFGYVYAAVGALACMASVPFEFDITETLQHALAALALAAAFVLARTRRTRDHDDHRADDYALVQAAAWGGLYLALNLRLVELAFGGLWYGAPFPQVGAPFYWFTCVMIWVLPLAGLYLAVRDKDRPLLDVSLVMLLMTLLTNKAYLGWPRHEWDPIVLGVVLIAAATAGRRWLAAGTNGQRGGFTPARILSKDAGAVTILGTASAAFHPEAPSYPESDTAGFDGGRSGGGGATGSY